MLQNDEFDVICRLPRLEDLSLQDLVALDRRVLADVIQEKIEKATG